MNKKKVTILSDDIVILSDNATIIDMNDEKEKTIDIFDRENWISTEFNKPDHGVGVLGVFIDGCDVYFYECFVRECSIPSHQHWFISSYIYMLNKENLTVTRIRQPDFYIEMSKLNEGF